MSNTRRGFVSILTDSPIGNGRHSSVHQVLKHDVCGILRCKKRTNKQCQNDSWKLDEQWRGSRALTSSHTVQFSDKEDCMLRCNGSKYYEVKRSSRQKICSWPRTFSLTEPTSNKPKPACKRKQRKPATRTNVKLMAVSVSVSSAMMKEFNAAVCVSINKTIHVVVLYCRKNDRLHTHTVLYE